MVKMSDIKISVEFEQVVKLRCINTECINNLVNDLSYSVALCNLKRIVIRDDGMCSGEILMGHDPQDVTSEPSEEIDDDFDPMTEPDTIKRCKNHFSTWMRVDTLLELQELAKKVLPLDTEEVARMTTAEVNEQAIDNNLFFARAYEVVPPLIDEVLKNIDCCENENLRAAR